jgi:uncharacterized repeat protein (TIGR03803 family)
MFVDRGVLRALLCSAAAFCAFAPSAQANPYTVLHNFTGGPGDGTYPAAEVQFDDAGNLYGTTSSGGAHNAGVIFKIAPDGTETVLHSFDDATGGGKPGGAATIDPASGDLYGVTAAGGDLDACPGGCGVIYKYSADGTFTVLHNFDGNKEGANPTGRLIRDTLGNFYGVALSGGSNGDGTVFRYAANGKLKVLHAFAGNDGTSPRGVISDRAGNLYGVTSAGGTDNDGTVYRVAPDGTFTTLYSFTGGSDGLLPVGGLDRDKKGNLHGTTELGGAANSGTVFKLAPDGTFTTLYAFVDADGGYPEGNILLIDGTLYGTTEGGGDATCHCGVVFKLAPDGTETVLHRFIGSDGGAVYAGLTKHDGNLYGTTGFYGSFNDGVVFRVKKK